MGMYIDPVPKLSDFHPKKLLSLLGDLVVFGLLYLAGKLSSDEHDF